MHTHTHTSRVTQTLTQARLQGHSNTHPGMPPGSLKEWNTSSTDTVHRFSGPRPSPHPSFRASALDTAMKGEGGYRGKGGLTKTGRQAICKHNFPPVAPGTVPEGTSHRQEERAGLCTLPAALLCFPVGGRGEKWHQHHPLFLVTGLSIGHLRRPLPLSCS